MQKTDPVVFSPGPLLSDLTKLGVAVTPRDADISIGPGRPRKDDEPMVPVAGRVTTQDRKMLTMIVESGAIPGIETTTDAVRAAVELFIGLVFPRLKHNGLTESWKSRRVLKRMYEAAQARTRILHDAEMVRNTLRLLLTQEDEDGIIVAMKAAWEVAENLALLHQRPYINRVLKDLPELLLTTWEEVGAKAAPAAFDVWLNGLDMEDPE